MTVAVGVILNTNEKDTFNVALIKDLGLIDLFRNSIDSIKTWVFPKK